MSSLLDVWNECKTKGLTFRHQVILSILRENGGEMVAADIAKKMGIHYQSVSTLLRELADRELVQSTKHHLPRYHFTHKAI